MSLVCLALFLTSTVEANTYPQKINENKNFETLSDFQNIYQKIYDDITKIDETEVIKRACEHESIDCELAPDETKKNLKHF